MIYNMWVSASAEMKSELKRWVRGDYTTDPGPKPAGAPSEFAWPQPGRENTNPLAAFPEIEAMSQDTRELFEGFLESDTTENFLEQWQAAGRVYKIWSVYATKPERTPLVRSDLDMLSAAHWKDFSVMGAWSWDGSHVGNPPWYPIPPELINFMPNDVLEDVHLLVGQSPRDFS